MTLPGALQLCPKGALNDVASIHQALGVIYFHLGQTDNAREHFEEAAQYFIKTGNRYDAGQVRISIAHMYAQLGTQEGQAPEMRANLVRALAYSEAALRDYQHYQGRAAKEEEAAQQIIDGVHKALSKLTD